MKGSDFQAIFQFSKRAKDQKVVVDFQAIFQFFKWSKDLKASDLKVSNFQAIFQFFKQDKDLGVSDFQAVFQFFQWKYLNIYFFWLFVFRKVSDLCPLISFRPYDIKCIYFVQILSIQQSYPASIEKYHKCLRRVEIYQNI